MKDEFFSNFNGLEKKACITCFNVYYRTYKDMRDDFLYYGYIGILEKRKNFENMADEDLFRYYFYLARLGMQSLILKLSKDNVISSKFVSFDDYVSNSEDSDTFEIFFGYDDKYSLDFEFLKNCFYKIFDNCNYTKTEKNLLYCYFFDKDNLKAKKRKTKISYNVLDDLVKDFRQKYFELLKQNNYLNLNDYDYLFDENKAVKKSDKEIRNNLKIYKLLKDISIEDIAKTLNITTEKVENILSFKYNRSKFYLYQIQKLRLKFFPNYTLEELVENVEIS